MKLKPNLDDWWTRNGNTELNYKKDSISGMGVSMKVILHLFKDDENLIFYSYKPDELYEEGDIYLFAFEKSKIENLNLEKKLYEKGKSPIVYWYGESIQIEEYELTENIREEFGFSFRKMFESKLKSFIKYNLYFHDNFIFGLFPIKTEMLKKVITNIRWLHSYYLDYEIESLKFDTLLLEELKEEKKIRLRSYRKEGKSVLIKKEIAKKGIKKFLKFKVDKETVIYKKYSQ